MFMIKYILVTLLVLGSAFAFNVGDTFNQQQINNANNIQRNVLFIDGQTPSINKVEIKFNFYVLGFDLLHLKNNKDGTYTFIKKQQTIILPIYKIKECFNRYNKQVCMNNYINPYIKSEAIKRIDSEIQQIYDYQTRNKDIEENEIIGLQVGD